MSLLRKVGIPLLAILILLVLLLAVLILVYEQNGLLLPFASQPGNQESETVACFPSKIETMNNTIILNWRIMK